MKILKLLNKKNLSIIALSLLFGITTYAQEPVDIWNVEEKKIIEDKKLIEKIDEENIPQNTIYEMQSQKEYQVNIEQDQTLLTNEVDIIGLYDPAENGFNINMWSNSDGNQILNIFERINKINLSKDAAEILDIVLLTNAYYPVIDISKEQFDEIKSDWLIKNSNLQLIENYLLNNQIINTSPKLAKYLVDYYLSRSELQKSCEILSNIKKFIEDEYLSKFHIYCLINNNKKEEAQLLLDLKKEIGFKDEFYEKKISYLMEYDKKSNTDISENTILDFHLSHRTNPKFKFEPKDSTSSQIWKYLATSNLMGDIQDIELTNFYKIETIEKATHEKNYTEQDLYDLYKRFQFNINQILNIKESSSVLSSIESRALIYQGILITTETGKKLELMNALKNSFINEGKENAFNKKLSEFLKGINVEEIPANFTTFYEKYIDEEKVELLNIKINNKVLHQSKLVNYFKDDISSKDITKDLNNLLKKIKKDKKYFFSKKDVILVEALKSDGILASNKYKNLYEISESEMPLDIQSLIDNNEMGVAMLRIVEVIGQDELKNIDVDTMYFIINTLNQLNVDPLRNKILLKVLPLKV